MNRPPEEPAESNPGALQGIRILDLTRVLAGPYCSMVLSDYGAEIIKIERPGSGDDTRQWGPPWLGKESAYFLSVNRNKQSVTIDLKHPEGQAIVRRLAAKSDVLIENFKPGTATRLGLGYEQLSTDHPGLVYCSITGYGQNGPYRDRPGYDFMIQAQGGLMSITGPATGKPHKVGVAIVDISTGLFAATAILAALHARKQNGQGQHIDVSLFDSQIAWLANVGQAYLSTKQPPKRYGNQHPNIVPYQTFSTTDGQVAIAVGNDNQYQRFCTAIGHQELWSDSRFQTNDGRVTHRQQLIPLLSEILRSKPSDYWLDVLLDARIPVSPINNIPAALHEPQIDAREMVQTVIHDTLGEVDLVGPVAKFSRTPATIRSAPPTLGAQTNQVLGRLLDLDDRQLLELEQRGITEPQEEEQG